MKKILYGIVFVLPFILGAIGFYLGGEIARDSLYYSLSLYFMSLNSDSVNPLIEIARWMAPVMTASGLILAIKSAVSRLRDKVSCMHGDATAVYSDGGNANGELLMNTLKHGIASDKAVVRGARSHILMFENDVDNLNFYQTNQAFFENQKVYMKLEKMDSYLLKESKVHFFNSNEIIARQYWKERHLLSYLDAEPASQQETDAVGEQLQVDVAIVGFGPLGQRMLQYGLLNNIYSNKQRITYHVFGDSRLYQQVYPSFPMMNQDSIVFHVQDWREDFSIFSKMERVILTEEPDLELVQDLLYTCNNTRIDYFSKGNIVLEDVYKTDLLYGYGKATDIYTEENIKTDRLYQAAMELNYKYACLYGGVCGSAEEIAAMDKKVAMEREWNALDGFTKGSNITSADYHEIRKQVIAYSMQVGKELTPDELAEGEHIRWSRFHFLNHWSYGVPENGKNKDGKKKIHVCLVPYEELPEKEKKKDFEAVELLLELFQ